MLFYRGFLLVSRPCVFAVFNLNEVYLPHIDIELVSSAYISARLSCLWHLVQMRSGWQFGFLGNGMTKMASGRLEVSLSLADKRVSNSQLGSVLLLAYSGICWRFCWAKRSVLPASNWTKQPAREPLLIAFMMSLQATLWHSVIIPEMILCWHPERIWRALSACWQSGHRRLADILKRKRAFD